jgi:hypothetical protein
VALHQQHEQGVDFVEGVEDGEEVARVPWGGDGEEVAEGSRAESCCSERSSKREGFRSSTPDWSVGRNSMAAAAWCYRAVRIGMG